MILIGEYLALLMIAILTLFFYDKRRMLDTQTKIYWSCLGFSAVSVILNICCVEVLTLGSDAPRWVPVLLNSFYFLISVWTCTLMAWYVMYKILEHVYERHCMYRAMTVLVVLNLAFLLLILVNLKTGWVFWIDGAGGYHRGVLNRAGYGVMLLEILAGLICYMRNAGSVGRQVARAIKMIIGMELFLLMVQQMFPEVLLNGILMAFADMIFLMHFQSQKNGMDMVTGLGSRIRFLDEVSLRLGGEQQFQILLVSLKDFNLINRKYGYTWGSNVLYHVGDYLEGWGVKSDAFRFSNVTFAVFCPYLSAEQAEQNLESLKQRFREEWEISNERIRLSARIVELIHRQEPWQPYEVMDYLEYMLYYAKEQDMEVLRFDEKARQQYHRNRYLTQAIRTAIEQTDFQVWYQPIYCVARGRFLSAEALVRMYTPEGEWVSPSEFIPLAEGMGMVEAINWIVLEKVCRFWNRHEELPLNSISVNMTSEQMAEKEFWKKLEAMMRAYRVPKEKLRIEITERVISVDDKAMCEKMRQMWNEGYRFYLDDFGVGYSNIYNVMHLPFECVKLDKSLMDDLSTDQANARMVQEITKVFHDIGQMVVAEGIETEAQSKLAAGIGIDKIQGFYYARPMPEDKFLAFLENTPAGQACKE